MDFEKIFKDFDKMFDPKITKDQREAMARNVIRNTGLDLKSLNKNGRVNFTFQSSTFNTQL